MAAGRLQDIFTSSQWNEHVATLSRALGFSLGAYSDSGAPLLPEDTGPSPFCRPLRDSTAFRAECERSCRERALRVLTSRQPRWYACNAGVMSFALPVSYLEDRAVVLGQGSFASYDNYRSYLDLLHTSAPDAPVPVSATLRFTTERDAQNACLLIERSIELLLRRSEETVELKKRVANLERIMRSWPGAGGAGAELSPENLAETVRGILDVRYAAVLSPDRPRNRFVTAHRAAADPSFTDRELDADGHILRSLCSGAPFVVTAEPAAGAVPAGLSAVVACCYFPVMVRGRVEHLLLVCDSRLGESDRQTILSLCRQAGRVLENRKLQRDLSWKLSRIAAITELAREISNIDSYDALLRSILERSAKLLMAEQGSLMMMDQETNALLLEAKMGDPGNAVARVPIPRGEGIAGLVAERGEPFLVEDVEHDPRIAKKNRSNYRTPSFISVPLRIGDRTIGVLNFSDKATGEVFDRDDLYLIQSFATHAAVVLERSALTRRTDQLLKLSITDPLTGLLNRRYFQERLEEEVARSLRHDRSLSLLMLDVDRFKHFNDAFGHLAGDRALCLVGDTLQRMVRHMDIVARFGGDEFVVLLPETGPDVALQIAERIRREIMTIAPPAGHGAGPPEPVTVSIGIASYRDGRVSADEFFGRADQALYEAKANGRNRIEVRD